jgi:hypothetical protein
MSWCFFVACKEVGVIADCLRAAELGLVAPEAKRAPRCEGNGGGRTGDARAGVTKEIHAWRQSEFLSGGAHRDEYALDGRDLRALCG